MGRHSMSLFSSGTTYDEAGEANSKEKIHLQVIRLDRRDLSPYNLTQVYNKQARAVEKSCKVIEARLQDINEKVRIYSGSSSQSKYISESDKSISKELSNIRPTVEHETPGYMCRLDELSDRRWQAFCAFATKDYAFNLMDHLRNLVNQKISRIKRAGPLGTEEKRKLIQICNILGVMMGQFDNSAGDQRKIVSSMTHLQAQLTEIANFETNKGKLPNLINKARQICMPKKAFNQEGMWDHPWDCSKRSRKSRILPVSSGCFRHSPVNAQDHVGINNLPKRFPH